MTTYLEFEKPLAEIEGKAEELRALARANSGMDVEKEAGALDKEAAQLVGAIRAEVERLSKIAEQYLSIARRPKPSLERERVEDLVQELLTVVNYTRAAYGYAMAAGEPGKRGCGRCRPLVQPK